MLGLFSSSWNTGPAAEGEEEEDEDNFFKPRSKTAEEEVRYDKASSGLLTYYRKMRSVIMPTGLPAKGLSSMSNQNSSKSLNH